MNEQELDKQIRKSIQSIEAPSRSSFSVALLKLGDSVTEIPKVRYTIQTSKSNINHNQISKFFGIPRSKLAYLVPSFIAIFIFIGAFNLSPLSGAKHGQTLEQLAKESETIEEKGMDTDDILMVTSFDEPDIDDLSTTQNEL